MHAFQPEEACHSIERRISLTAVIGKKRKDLAGKGMLFCGSEFCVAGQQIAREQDH